MGRTREFNDEAVLDRAGNLFWRLGYEVVSIQDLEASTGLGRGSLYNAYGDKEGVFLAALDRYVTKFGSPPFAHLGHRDVGTGIHRMLEAIIARMTDPANPRGCLLTNSSLAFGTGSARIDTTIASKIQAMEAALEEAILRARDEGQIPVDADPKQLARFYCAVAQSLGLTHKALGTTAALHDIVTVAMWSWPGKKSVTGRGPASAIARKRKSARRPGGTH